MPRLLSLPIFFHFKLLMVWADQDTLIISYEQLRFLVENHFSVPQIANMLHVSVRTIFRRMSTFSLSIRSQYSRINDQELDFIVSEIQREFPNCGNRQMHGHLISCGLRIHLE